METELEVKKEKENYRASLFYKGRKKRKAYYWNLIIKDKNKLALLFLDLYMEGFPIEEAYKIMKKKIEERDWTGL